MNPLALLDPAVETAHTAVQAMAGALTPAVGPVAVAVALVLLTMIVRLALLPLSVRIARADKARRALAPTLGRLRAKHADDPARLMQELTAAHREAGVSPVAGLGAALAQAPVLTVVYRLCTLAVVSGGPNVVLTANLFGLPLSQHGATVLATTGLFSLPALVFVLTLALLAAVAAWSSSVTLARMPAAEASAQNVARTIARVAPFGAVAAAAVVPFAVSLYLLVSTTWATTERVVLARVV